MKVGEADVVDSGGGIDGGGTERLELDAIAAADAVARNFRGRVSEV